MDQVTIFKGTSIGPTTGFISERICAYCHEMTSILAVIFSPELTACMPCIQNNPNIFANRSKEEIISCLFSKSRLLRKATAKYIKERELSETTHNR